MIAALSPLSKFVKNKHVSIYDAIFSLHGKYTVGILLLCTILLSTKQYFGDPMQCIFGETNVITHDYANNYCWQMGTYHKNETMDNRNRIPIRHSFSYIKPRSKIESEPERIYFRYYQWVAIIFLVQAFVFHFPTLLWKKWEGGKLSYLCAIGDPIFENEEYVMKKGSLLNYFTMDLKDLHFWYTVRYISCELVNFLICILNIFAMDLIFHSFWSNYATALMAIPSYDWMKWNDLSSVVFPKTASCEIKKFGPSGTHEIIDALCLLTLNILNEKLFAFLFVWFIFLTIMSGLNVIYEFSLMCCRPLRLQLLRVRVPSMSVHHINRALNDFNFSDWFVLHKFSSNVNPLIFRDLMLELYQNRKSKMCDI